MQNQPQHPQQQGDPMLPFALQCRDVAALYGAGFSAMVEEFGERIALDLAPVCLHAIVVTAQQELQRAAVNAPAPAPVAPSSGTRGGTQSW